MQKDRRELEKKIDTVNTKLASELSKVTEPFTVAINNLQASQQHFFGMFQQFVAPQLQHIQPRPILPAPLLPIDQQLPLPDVPQSSMQVVPPTTQV